MAFRAQFVTDPFGGTPAYAEVGLAPSSHYTMTINCRVPQDTIDALAAWGPGNTAALVFMGDLADFLGDFAFGTFTGIYQFEVAQGPAGGALITDTDFDVVAEFTYDSGTLWDIQWTIAGTPINLDTSVDCGVTSGDPMPLFIGAPYVPQPPVQTYFVNSVWVDGIDSMDHLFDDDFASGDFSKWDTVVGDASVVDRPIPPAAQQELSPLWRFVIGDLATFEVLSFLDTLASNRQATYVLNQPAVASMVVPSENPEINIPWPDSDSDPFLTEGTRVLWGLRRENTTDPWIIRFAGLILQLEDNAESDNAYTTLTAWDPWQYLLSRPVCQDDGSLPGPNGLSFTATRVDVIIATLLRNTIDNQGVVGIDAGVTYSGTTFYDGTLDASEAIDINFQQGTTVGQAWQQLCDGDYCDIILEPIYDPNNRPGYLAQLNVYDETGTARDDAIFAWDEPSRSLVGIHRLTEGNQRANAVKYFAGQGGSAPGGQTITLQEDAASIAKFGEYWRQTFFPNQVIAAVVQALAFAQLQLSKNGRVTVTFSPAPQRSPSPFTEYFLGDRVPVYASSRFRAPIPNVDVASSNLNNYQRIYGIPIVIADDATEQIQSMLTAIPTAGS